ncbi:MAG TPA: molybdopterin-dependent oxidoreductase [Roseiarcus sp.]|nr:molybdopterin-dependent oxidoreductase [Roseiarcus sp.]
MNQFILNGLSSSVPGDLDATLIEVIRDAEGLTGTKQVCGAGVCGACTVLLDGAPIAACVTPARAALGKSVVTIEGIGGSGLHPVQRAFMALDALQCGFCTPGFVVEAVSFYNSWREKNRQGAPPQEEIAAALSGHLCRCGAYENILRALAEACAGRFDADVVASPRLEARDKVTGAAKYTVDLRYDGQLEGVILRSKVAHAIVESIDLSGALAVPGVEAAISLLNDDRTVRYVGQHIAAVAARDKKTAALACGAIVVAFRKLPHVVGLEAARMREAALAFTGSRKNVTNAAEGLITPTPWKRNIRGPSSSLSLKAKKARSLIAEARAAGDPLLFEGTFRTGAQQHCSLEPHAAVARFDGDQLTVNVSTQAVWELRKQIAKRIKLDPSKVRVVAEHVGGGFGSKGSLGAETIAAILLARAAKAPVRVALDRREELSVAGYRPAAELNISLLPDRDGGLKALSFNAYADTGTSVNSTIAGLARFIYRAPAKELCDFDVVSNLPPGSAFRGPGGPPMAFALEQAVDEAALKLKLDPIELRKRWDDDPNRARLYDWAAALGAWGDYSSSREQTGRYRRGIGVAAGYWLYLWQLGAKVELSLEGGRIIAATATQDIGTGSRSVLANVVAKELGLEPHEIEIRIGDSRLPEGPGSGGSRSTASIVPAALVALEKLKDGIAKRTRREVQAGSNAPWREMIAECPNFSVSGERARDSRNLSPGVRSPVKDAGLIGAVFSFMFRRFLHLAVGAGAPSCVQVAEVEVDTLLGQVRVLKVQSAIAAGKIAAPALARNQASGSIIQGVGYALYEGREIDLATGEVLSAGMEDYRIPGIADTPAIEVHFDEQGFDHVPGGGVGIGEVATVPTAAAIANAVRNATGVRPTEIPLRPDRLLRMLREGARV